MSNPYLIQVPFASNGDRNDIQTTKQQGQDPEDATWSIGFPPQTMIPESAGGIAPKGLDFNGLFYAISSIGAHYSRGDQIQFDATFAEKIGGYSKGFRLASNDYQCDFISLVDNNTVDPNGTNISQNWRVYAGQDSIPVATSTTNGTVKLIDSLSSTAKDAALTAAQGKVLSDRTQSATDKKEGISRFATPTEVVDKANVMAAVTPANVAAMIKQFPTIKASVKSGSNGGVFGGIGFSTVVRLSNGNFEFTLSSPAPNTNYIVMLTSSWGGRNGAASVSLDPDFAQTTTKFRVICRWGGDNTSGSFDPVTLNAIVIY